MRGIVRTDTARSALVGAVFAAAMLAAGCAKDDPRRAEAADQLVAPPEWTEPELVSIAASLRSIRWAAPVAVWIRIAALVFAVLLDFNSALSGIQAPPRR